MQLARRFNEVVVVDATYKTNQFRLPFVNMVGVHNVGSDDETLSNFAIAGAWVAKEDEVSYSWVMEQLSNTVYLDGKWKPALFVTDQAQSLINAIEKHYPSANHLLCYVHLLKNLKTHTLRYFTSVEKYGKAESLFKKMCLTSTQDEFDCAYDSLVALALKTTNDKGAAIKAYLNRYI
jgi:transposase-like protein